MDAVDGCALWARFSPDNFYRCANLLAAWGCDLRNTVRPNGEIRARRQTHAAGAHIRRQSFSSRAIVSSHTDGEFNAAPLIPAPDAFLFSSRAFQKVTVLQAVSKVSRVGLQIPDTVNIRRPTMPKRSRSYMTASDDGM